MVKGALDVSFKVDEARWFKSVDKFLHIWDWNKTPTTVHTKIWRIFKHGTAITVSDSELQLLWILMANYFFRHRQGPLPSNQEPTQLPRQEPEEAVKQLIPRLTLSRTSQCDLPRLSDFHCGVFLFEVSISDKAQSQSQTGDPLCGLYTCGARLHTQVSLITNTHHWALIQTLFWQS